MMVCGSVLLLVCLLFSMTQVRDTHYKASAYLLFAAVSLLITLAWQLNCMADEPLMKELFRLCAFATAVAFLTLAALLAVTLWSVGYVIDRTLTAAIFALMLASLLNGVTLGALIQRGLCMTSAGALWLRGIRLLCLLVAITIAAGMVIGQAQRISHAKHDAEIWDATHQEILRLRDAEDPTVYTKPFPQLIHEQLDSVPSKYKYGPLDWLPMIYYGLKDGLDTFPGCRCPNNMDSLDDGAPFCAKVICLAYGKTAKN